MEITRKDIDLIRILTKDVNAVAITDLAITESLRQTEIIHLLSAIKLIGIENEELKEINERIKILLESNGKV